MDDKEFLREKLIFKINWTKNKIDGVIRAIELLEEGHVKFRELQESLPMYDDLTVDFPTKILVANFELSTRKSDLADLEADLAALDEE